MFMKRRLSCSFCRKSEKDVAKLVAGPGLRGVYICDECVAIAARLMQDDSHTPAAPEARAGLLARFRDRLRWLIGPNRESVRCDNPL